MPDFLLFLRSVKFADPMGGAAAAEQRRGGGGGGSLIFDAHVALVRSLSG